MLNAIFDFNGTMFFDEAFQEKAWQQYMTEKLDRRITPEEFQTWIHGRNTGDTLEYFFGRPFPQQEADEEEEAEETISPRPLPPEPGLQTGGRTGGIFGFPCGA